MSGTARLVVDSFDRYGGTWSVGWDFDDGEGINCWLGESEHASPSDDEDGDVVPAEKAAAEYVAANPDCFTRAKDIYRGAYMFAQKKHAAAVLALAKAAIKAALDPSAKPLEGWEKQALAAGWTPPKGRIK